jgi:hypothetical protein
MSGTITWEMILGLSTLAGFILGIWWRVEAKISAAEEAASQRALGAQTKADTAAADLAVYKIHVAENYANKDGVTRQFDAVSKSITEFGDRMEKRLDGMNERLDRVIEAGQRPHPVRRTQN